MMIAVFVVAFLVGYCMCIYDIKGKIKKGLLPYIDADGGLAWKEKQLPK